MANSSESDTASVESLYLKTTIVHDRRYQQYALDNLVNLVPVDEDEQERLNTQHTILDFVFDQRQIFPPLVNPEKILDCGYGSGAWAVEVAEQYPDCEVTGIDISPHMRPEETPENVQLQLDDLNRPFTFDANTFDLVHSRFLSHGINRLRWTSYLRDIHRALKPGGWLQMVELYYNCQSDNGTLTDRHALRQWSSYLRNALDGVKDLRAPLRLHQLMSNAGFIDLQSRMIPLPLCAWPTDPRDREIGRVNNGNIGATLSSLALYPFSERLGMSEDGISRLLSQACSEANDQSLKPYFPLYICIGRKPGHA